MNWTLSLGAAGREHLAALGYPVRPVGEAVGRVVRADDQPGADDQRPAGQALLRPPARTAP